MQRRNRHAVAWTAAVLLLSGAARGATEDTADAASLWSLRLYTDIGYGFSDDEPANHRWRTKVTTSWLDEPELFLGMANVAKRANSESRWGFEFGLQAGKDPEALVPPPAEAVGDPAPIANADVWRYLYRANASYLFDAGRGVRLTGGLFDSFVGYRSYLAIDNPNYTRGYILDYVPYFMLGFEAIWDVSEQVDLGFYLLTGGNYLADAGDAPLSGVQLKWRMSPHMTFTQNVLFGPDQDNTNLAYWGVLSDSILEWQRGRLLLAGCVDYGRERQSTIEGQPLSRWGAAAFWAQWLLSERVTVAVRPEVYWDPDGQSTNARQTLQGYTGTVKYTVTPGQHRLVGTLEVRFDRSTGEQGGFFAGPDNHLVADQWTVFGAVLWSFEGWPSKH